MKTTSETKQKMIAKRVLVMSCLSAVLGLTGCPDGSSEKAGQRMDRAADNAEKTIEQSSKTASKQLEGLKDTVEQKAEQAKDSIDQSTESAKEALEKSEDKVEQNAEQVEKKVEQIKENVEKKLDDIKDSTTEKSETAGEYIDDSVITTKVKAAILGSSWLSASHIDVTTNKGIVVLSGTVDTEQNIARAIEVARSQENVKAVETNLIVSVAESSKK
ncbi:MAG: BON domain-containing protein [Methyloglobulus sp.]|nr:BON domain-containing protein [Methyloglobulus sp.]